MQNNSQIPNLTNNDFTAWTGTLEQVRQKNVPACKAAPGENCQAFVSQTDRADHLVILLADEIETRYEFYNQLHGCPQRFAVMGLPMPKEFRLFILEIRSGISVPPDCLLAKNT